MPAIVEAIVEIGIDNSGRLYAIPAATDMQFIWRAGKGVHWNDKERWLYVARMGRASPAAWFDILLSAVKDEYGIALTLTPATCWKGITPEAQHQMERLQVPR